MTKPKPPIPPEANLRGSEMAIDQFGMTREDAEKLVAQIKAQTPRTQ